MYIAAWFQPVRNFQALKDMGVNLLFGPEVENGGKLSPADLLKGQQNWMAQAEQMGFKVVLKVGAISSLVKVSDNCVGILTNADEPNGKGVPAPKDEVSSLRTKFPSVPVYISLAGDKILDIKSTNRDYVQQIAALKSYLDLVDVATVNFYSKNRNADRYPNSHTASIIAICDMVRPGCRVLPWIEVNDQQLKPPPPAGQIARGPTPAEIEETWNLCVTLSKDGIGIFTTCRGGEYGWPESYLPMKDRDGVSSAPQYAKVKELALKANPLPPKLSPLDEWMLKYKKAFAAMNDRLTELESIVKSSQQQSAPAVSKVYIALPDNDYFADPRSVLPYNYGHASYFRPWTTDITKVTKAQVQAYAKACRDGDGAFQPITVDGTPGRDPVLVIKGAPCSLDYEGEFGKGKDDVVISAINTHLDWFFEVYPNAKIALIGTQLYDDNDSVKHAKLFAMHSRCTSLVTGAYVYRPSDFTRMAGVVRQEVSRLQNLYPSKSIQMWLMPSMMDEPYDLMPPNTARSDFAFAVETTSRPGDSIVLYTRTWKEKLKVFGDYL